MDKTRGLQDGAGHLAGRREKEFFFAKKNQKIFAPCRRLNAEHATA